MDTWGAKGVPSQKLSQLIEKLTDVGMNCHGIMTLHVSESIVKFGTCGDMTLHPSKLMVYHSTVNNYHGTKSEPVSGRIIFWLALTKQRQPQMMTPIAFSKCRLQAAATALALALALDLGLMCALTVLVNFLNAVISFCNALEVENHR